MSALPQAALQDAVARREWLDRVDRAIVRTLTYSALFRAPMRLPELHRKLMDVAIDRAALLERVRALRGRVCLSGDVVHPPGGEAWIAEWRRRGRHSRRLLLRHRRLLTLAARCPFVRLLALSGSCAHENAADDDVDVFVVARTGRAWTVYLSLIVLSRLLGLRRTLCANYIVDETALILGERDLFTAAEIVGLRPLAGRAAYRRFVSANAWVARPFPNFFRAHVPESEALREAGSRSLEALLDMGIAPALEALARRVLGRRLERRSAGASGVVLDSHRLKLHLRDHRPRTNEAFLSALRRLGDDLAASVE